MVRLYLVRHGEAVPEAVDPERPLSEAGEREVRRVAEFLGQAGVRAARVLHSGKARARQTAEIVAAALAPGQAVEAESGLGPNDPTGPVVREIDDWRQDTLIVGHLPFLGKLVDRLIASREDLGIVVFEPGSVACLERSDGGAGWALAWMLGPELVTSTQRARE